MSSAICFKLDQSKILSSCNVLSFKFKLVRPKGHCQGHRMVLSNFVSFLGNFVASAWNLCNATQREKNMPNQPVYI